MIAWIYFEPKFGVQRNSFLFFFFFREMPTEHLIHLIHLIKWHLLCHSIRHFFRLDSVKVYALNVFIHSNHWNVFMEYVRSKHLFEQTLFPFWITLLKRLYIFLLNQLNNGIKDMCVYKKLKFHCIFFFISWFEPVCAYHDFIWFGLISDVEIFMGRRHQSNKCWTSNSGIRHRFRLKQREWMVTNYLYACSLLSKIAFKSLPWMCPC